MVTDSLVPSCTCLWRKRWRSSTYRTES